MGFLSDLKLFEISFEAKIFYDRREIRLQYMGSDMVLIFETSKETVTDLFIGEEEIWG